MNIYKNPMLRYRDWTEISQGSFGIIYKSFDLASNTYAVIKKQKEGGETKREWGILKTLNHPNIIKVYDYVENLKCLVMEYSPLGDLLTYINDKYISEAEIKIIYYQLILALNYLHKKGYVHCDVKLENIVMFEDLTIKLIDFGFCTTYSKEKKYKLGSFNYNAPEILLKVPVLGPELDIWSSGIVLYAMAYKILPIPEKVDPLEYYDYLATRGLKFSSKYPRSQELKDLLSKILVIDPKKRITGEKIMESEWIRVKVPKLDINAVPEFIDTESSTPSTGRSISY